MARRILDNHTLASNEERNESVYSTEEIRKYIMFARCFRPKVICFECIIIFSGNHFLRKSGGVPKFIFSLHYVLRKLNC